MSDEKNPYKTPEENPADDELKVALLKSTYKMQSMAYFFSGMLTGGIVALFASAILFFWFIVKFGA